MMTASKPGTNGAACCCVWGRHSRFWGQGRPLQKCFEAPNLGWVALVSRPRRSLHFLPSCTRLKEKVGFQVCAGVLVVSPESSLW